ncbi:MAG: hypothetical protein ABJB03_08120 [Rhodoglobus sp.]
MTLNQNFAGANLMRGRRKLEGPDRMLDVLVGIVIIVVELLVGFLAVYTLYETAVQLDTDNASAGFWIALFGGGAALVITTLVYLVRIARGTRSWGAPLWGLILLSAACFAGYFILSGSL